MKKIFISGPIAGVPNYRENFRKAEELLVSSGAFIPLNPAILPEGMEAADYMRITFAMLETADGVLLLDKWWDSVGASLEHRYAAYIGKPIMDIAEFLERCNKSPFDSTEGKPVASASRVERMFGPKETWSKKTEPTSDMNEIIEAAAARPKRENRKQEQQEGYRGFLLIRCPDCGKVQAFCARNNITETKCRECGASVPLEDLIPAHVNCTKCGGHYRYRTNIITQEPVPFQCLGCKAPVDLELNGKGTALVTIGYSHGGGAVIMIRLSERRNPFGWRGDAHGNQR